MKGDASAWGGFTTCSRVFAGCFAGHNQRACSQASLSFMGLCVKVGWVPLNGPMSYIRVQYSDKFMYGFVKFFTVLLRSLWLCFCTVL